MSNANKAKGTRFESSVRNWLLDRRSKAWRPAQTGHKDEGDVHLDNMVALQCKDAAQQRYSAWVEDANEQAVNAGLPYGVVVHKKRGKPIGESLVVLDLDTFHMIQRRLRVAEDFIWASNARTAYETTIAEIERGDA